jgi:hypothetical protein
MLPALMVTPTTRTLGSWSGCEEGLAMRHKPRLDRQIAYTAGGIGLGLLPVAMAVAALLIP